MGAPAGQPPQPMETRMSLTRPSDVKALLAEMEFHPSKVLGQNFLIDGNILRILVDLAGLCPTDQVLEVGPGLGVLTEALLPKCARLVAIEKDRRLHAHLAARLGALPHLDLRNADILDVNLDEILDGGVRKVIANLPYSVGSRFLVALFETRQQAERIIVTVQKEVAQRLAAKPSTPDYGLLGILAQLRYRVTIPKEISPTCFFPAPDVVSSIVQLQVLPEALDQARMLRMKSLLKHCFLARRKQARTSLKQLAAPAVIDRIFEELQIDPRLRPEDMAIPVWLELESRLRPPLNDRAGS